MSLLDTASLLLTPNAYKEGKLYSVIPSDGSGDMSVTRATTATRVNEAGLVEIVPYNLLSWSEQFDNSYWLKDSGVTVNSNVANAPNGTLTADRINFSAAGNALYSVINLTTTAKLSVYLKGEGANIGKQIYLEIAGTGSLSVTLTNEWNRFIIDANNANAIAIKRLSSGQADSVLAWGIQLNEGSTALPYQKTETRLNIPRLDYSNGTCPSLLVEPQRTNLLTYSEQFDNADWGKAFINITANSIVSPDGNTNADKIIVDSTPSNHWLGRTGFTLVSGSNYSFSIYAKNNGYNLVLSVGSSTIYTNCNFNLNNGTISTPYATVGANLCTATMENVGNGWYRCTINFTAFMALNALLYSANNTTTTPIGSFGMEAFAGDNISGYYLWGAQIEAGTYPTSYIPTTSASVTRNADYLTRSGFGNTSTSGTLFFDFYAEKIESPNGQYILNLFQGSVVNTSYPIYSSPNGLSIIANGGTIDIRNNAFSQQVQTFTPTQGQRVKIAVRYNGTNVSSAINGTLSSVFADTSVGVKNALRINNGENSTHAFNAVAFFPSYLTDTQLAQLTTI